MTYLNGSDIVLCFICLSQFRLKRIRITYTREKLHTKTGVTWLVHQFIGCRIIEVYASTNLMTAGVVARQVGHRSRPRMRASLAWVGTAGHGLGGAAGTVDFR